MVKSMRECMKEDSCYSTQIEIPNLLHSLEVSAPSVAVVLPSMLSVNMGIKIITVISRL